MCKCLSSKNNNSLSHYSLQILWKTKNIIHANTHIIITDITRKTDSKFKNKMNTLLQKETKLKKLIAHSLSLLFHFRIMKKQTKTKLSYYHLYSITSIKIHLLFNKYFQSNLVWIDQLRRDNPLKFLMLIVKDKILMHLARSVTVERF